MEKNHGIDLKIVGGRIRAARQRLGLTQEKAAERTDITGQYWSLLE
ncbi:MAG: XRE family transcriptional regulator, partial [Clostridia bacterium]|nr:XRE family transcriptional regulator [Clostridia bacterium]